MERVEENFERLLVDKWIWTSGMRKGGVMLTREDTQNETEDENANGLMISSCSQRCLEVNPKKG